MRGRSPDVYPQTMYAADTISSAGMADPWTPTDGTVNIIGALDVTTSITGGSLVSDAGLALSGAISGATTIAASGLITGGSITSTGAFIAATAGEAVLLGDTSDPLAAGTDMPGYAGYNFTDPTLPSAGWLGAGFADASGGNNAKSVSGNNGVAFLAVANTDDWTADVSLVGVVGQVVGLAGSTGTITGVAALRASNLVDFGGATYERVYGLYVDSITGGTILNDAIHVVGGRTFLGGAIVGGSSLALSGAITGVTTLAMTGALSGGTTIAVSGDITSSGGDVQGATLTSDAGLALSGAISGATTIAASGLYTGTIDTIGAVSADAAAGLTLINTEEALIGAQQYSPSRTLRGEGWQTGANTSHEVAFHEQVIPVEGSGALPTGELRWFSEIDDVGWAHQFSMTSGGAFHAANANGPSVRNVAAGGADPPLNPNRANPTTGVGSAGVNLTLVTSGVEVVRVQATIFKFNVSVDLNSNNITELGTLTTTDAAGPAMYNLASGTGVVAFANDRAQATSGLGGAADVPEIVVDGNAIMNWAAGAITAKQFFDSTATAGITASTNQTQGQGALTSSINEIDSANSLDVVTMPAAAPGRPVSVINHSANTIQIFPATDDNLGAGVDLSIELEANETIDLVAYDSVNWAVAASTEIIHAAAIDEDNAVVYVVNAAVDFHAYHGAGITAGDLVNWTFDAGGAGTSHAITVIANSVGAPGVRILVTTGDAHTLVVGAIVSQTNLTSAVYTGHFKVLVQASTTTYEVAAVFTATDTGTMDEAMTLTCGAGGAGRYSIPWTSSATSAANNDTFDFQLMLNAAHIHGSKARDEFGTLGKFDTNGAAGAPIEIAVGDKISWALSNEDGTGNITVRNLTIVPIRL